MRHHEINRCDACLANGGEDKLESVIIELSVQGAEMRIQKATVKPDDGHCTVLKRGSKCRFLSVAGADIEENAVFGKAGQPMIQLRLAPATLQLLKVARHIVAAPSNKQARRQPVPQDHSVFWQMPLQASGKMVEFQLHWTSRNFNAALLCNRTRKAVFILQISDLHH